MGKDTSKGDRRPDKRVELFVTTDGELQMAGSYALHLQVLGGVLKKLSLAQATESCGRPGGAVTSWDMDVVVTYACELQNFGREILQHGSNVYSCFGANAHLVLCVLLQEALDTAAWKLKAQGSARGLRNDGWCAENNPR